MTTQQTFEFLAGYRPQADTQAREPLSRGNASRGKVSRGKVSRGKVIAAAVDAVQPSLDRPSLDRPSLDRPSLDRKPASSEGFASDREESGVGETESSMPERSAVSIRQEKQSEVADGPDQQAIVQDLRAKLGGMVSSGGDDKQEIWSTGLDELDHLLPHAGLRGDAITEWVAEADGCGAAALSLITAARRLNSSSGRGPLVVVCSETSFYPPAAIALGIPADRILWVRPAKHADLVWSIDQALRCESVAAVWAHVGLHLDDRDARRFQLAAEAGRTAGLLVRPAVTRGQPSFAEVRFHVASQCGQSDSFENHQESTAVTTDRLEASQANPHRTSRDLLVTLDRCRGGTVGQKVSVRIDEQGRLRSLPACQVISDSPSYSSRSVVTSRERNETAAVRLASKLAHPKIAGRNATQRRRA